MPVAKYRGVASRSRPAIEWYSQPSIPGADYQRLPILSVPRITTCEYGCVRASKGIERYASALDGFISNFHQHALLRIDCDGLLGRNVKEDVIKLVDDAVVKHVGAVDVGEAFARTAIRVIETFIVETGDFALYIS